MVCWFLLLSHLCSPLSTKLRSDVLSPKVRCVLNYLLLTSKTVYVDDFPLTVSCCAKRGEARWDWTYGKGR